jgi:Domain of unknown function (DUF1707)
MPGSDSSELRVSDQERERVAREIREHFAAGRLTDEELDHRLAAVYAARTQSELRGLRSDLPALAATPAEQRAELAQRRGHLQRRLVQQSGGAMAAFVLCTVIWLASGAQGMFWPVWVAVVALMPLLRNGWRMYGPAPELDRVERELARRERGEARRDARGGRRRRH